MRPYYGYFHAYDIKNMNFPLGMSSDFFVYDKTMQFHKNISTVITKFIGKTNKDLAKL